MTLTATRNEKKKIHSGRPNMKRQNLGATKICTSNGHDFDCHANCKNEIDTLPGVSEANIGRKCFPLSKEIGM